MVKTVLFSTRKIFEILEKYHDKSNTLCVLGSGWNHAVRKAKIIKEWDFSEVFGAKSGVSGHKGKLILARFRSKTIWIMAGRFHTYEGYTSREVTHPIQALAGLGVKNLILTSAAGGLNSGYKVGDIIILSDILSLFCQSPLHGANFQDLSKPFNPGLVKTAISVCKKNKINYRQGIYAYVLGPHFESFADKKALRILGADCVGMSMVAETIMGNSLGLNIIGLSCITNLAFVKHSHRDVLAASERASSDMMKLLSDLLSGIT